MLVKFLGRCSTIYHDYDAILNKPVLFGNL